MKKMFPWFLAILFLASAGLGLSDPARAENGLLVIENGSGSGEYSVGDLVPIEADQPKEGYTFHSWDGDVGGITDIYEPSTTVTVGSSRSDIYPVYMVEEARCKPFQGALKKDQTFMINVDAFTGDEDKTEPKIDKNDGKDGDNPQFRRHNVARGFKPGTINAYWYTSSRRKKNEPDPNGPQWVDYTPDFSKLGVGRYRIAIEYRSTHHRPDYPVHYYAKDTKTGDFLKLWKQNQHTKSYRWVQMGIHFMCKDSYVRVEDKGPGAISFKRGRFTYLGP